MFSETVCDFDVSFVLCQPCERLKFFTVVFSPNTRFLLKLLGLASEWELVVLKYMQDEEENKCKIGAKENENIDLKRNKAEISYI